MKLGILGGGESGVGAALLAQDRGYEVFLSDYGTIASVYRTELEAAGIPYEQSGHSVDKLLSVDTIVKSPGIPETAVIVQKLRDQKVNIISEIEFAYLHCNGKIIGITGSNGKTTTTLLIDHLLKTAGISAVAGGNLGDSFARLCLQQPYSDWYVIELSSFQLDDIQTFSPDIALLLNISADHLDRYHYAMANYAAAKFKIFENQRADQYALVNADDAGVREFGEGLKTKARKVPISGRTIDSNTYHSLSGHDVLLERFTLPGSHNRMNALFAIEAAILAGADVRSIEKGLSNFVNTSHRMEFVEIVDGVTYINDSKATNVESTYYALESTPKPVIWLAGGTDKGNDYKEIQPLVKDRVKQLVCIGLDNSKLLHEFSPLFDRIPESRSMPEAMQEIQKISKPGDTVLLSPACASFDLFKNYEDRGNQFKNEVRKLLNKV